MNSKFYQRSGQRSIGCYVSKLGYQQVNATVSNQSESRAVNYTAFHSFGRSPTHCGAICLGETETVSRSLLMSFIVFLELLTHLLYREQSDTGVTTTSMPVPRTCMC